MKAPINVLAQNIGNDFSHKDFKVCFWQSLEGGRQRIKSSKTFKNTLGGFKAFVQWVEKHRVTGLAVSIVLEPTGVYHENFLYYMNEHTDYQLHLVPGNQTKAYAISLGIYTKTDKVDAKVLGRLGLERKDLRIWKPFSPKLRIIKGLCRERVHLLELKTALTNRRHALENSFKPNQEEIKRLQAQIDLCKEQVKTLDKQIKQAVLQDKTLKEPIEKICKVKGLRITTVITIVAETNGFQLINNRSQLVSYSGYDVVQRQSGTSVNGKTKISKRGNRYIRRALHFPALTASQYDPNCKALYERVLQRSGIKMKAAVAVQRKLLVLIYALFTKNEEYDLNYQHPATKSTSKDKVEQEQPLFY